jgi:hypothetical protein
MRRLVLLLSLLPVAFQSCRECTDDPQPQCYSGTVIGETCLDGVIVEMDKDYPIGIPLQGFQNMRDSLVA